MSVKTVEVETRAIDRACIMEAPFARDTAQRGHPAVLVDIAGNRRLVHDPHAARGHDLKHSCATHTAALGASTPIPGTQQARFFTPTQIEAAIARMGASQFAQDLGQAFATFAAALPNRITFDVREGREAAMQTSREIRAVLAVPNEAAIIRLGPECENVSNLSGADR